MSRTGRTDWLQQALGVAPWLLAILACVGLAIYLNSGPEAPNGADGWPSAHAGVGLSLLVATVVLFGIVALLRGMPALAYRESRLPDGFEWRRPPVRQLSGVASVFYVGYLAALQVPYVAAAWLRQDWLRIPASGLLAALLAGLVLLAVRQMFSSRAVLSVTADGLMAGDRTLAWSQVEAVVFDRYRWREFGVVLAGGGRRKPREWWFSLQDAGIEAPHFLDRLERAAPQVEVLKPKGEPMAGAHPIPAA